MWRKLEIDDPKIDYYANLRNEYGCTSDFTGDYLAHLITKQRDFFIYEDDTYTILLGFAFDSNYGMTQFVAFAIHPQYDHASFKLIGEKTREYLIKHNYELVYNFEPLGINKMAIEEGVVPLMDMINSAFTEAGLTANRDYEKQITIISVV